MNGAPETPDPVRAHARWRVAVEVAIVWALLSLFAWSRSGADVLALRLVDTDDATRLVQVRRLLAGQPWWDLTLDRMGAAGVDMHWSRHMDGLLGGANVAARWFVAPDVAELFALVAVPFALLGVSLYLVSSLARVVTGRSEAGLYAMVIFGLGAAGLGRFGPGRIDHHGLQIVLILLMIRLVLSWPARRAAIGAGIAGGVSLTVGLETLPIVAAVLAGVGIRWALGLSGDRPAYRAFGLSLVGAVIVSGLAFAPPGRIVSLECDVFSLGLFGLIAVPALGLAAVGGASWRSSRRWLVLAALLSGSFVWLAALSPRCAAGPYAELPAEGRRVWLDLITEARGVASFAETFPLEALALALGPVLALIVLAFVVWKRRWVAGVPWLVALSVAVGMGTWQVRVLVMGLAMAAPVLGLVAAAIRDRVRWVAARAVVTLVVLVTVSGLVFGFLAQFLEPAGGSATRVSGPCMTDELRHELAALPAGLIAAEMNLGPDILVHTDHRVLAPQYHRDYQSVLDMYDVFVSDGSTAEARLARLGVDYVVICEETTISRVWSADAPEGLLSRLLADEPPNYLTKIVDAGRSRVYAMRR